MVSLPPGNRRGASTFGCLLSLVIFGIVAYYGAHVGAMYWRYYQLRDEMRINARLAPNLTDEVIRRRLANKVDEVFGPRQQIQFRVARPGRGRKISITTEYRDSVDLPLFRRGFPFRIQAEEPI
ncbi:MAG TPA: hypothetical protein VFU46_10495 [Gemmatimonadales bacterium]|nr:hypothetical protein [Gemmatimonadales bacterium]